MKRFWKTRLPALVLTAVMMVTLLPTALAASADLTYTVKPGESVSFSASDFESFYDSNCSGTFQYAEFCVSESKYNAFDGAVEYRSNVLDADDLNDNYFYDSDASYGSYPLKRLSLTAGSSADAGTLSVEFTVYGETSSGREKSASGTLALVISKKGGASSGKGDITYEVAPGKEVAFDEGDFETFFDENCSGSFRYVTFEKPSSSNYADGSIYYRYGRSSEVAFTRNALANAYFSFGDYGDEEDYPLDDLSFVADDDFEGPVTIAFTVHGSRSSEASGTLVITTKGGSGDIAYEVSPGDEVDLDEDDFEDYYTDHCSGTFKYVIFDRPASGDYADGYLYHNYGRSSQTYFTRSELDDYRFCYTGYGDEDEDYTLDDLSFVADSDFEGPVTLTFTVYGGTGSRTNQSEEGTLVIRSGETASKPKGDITYPLPADDEAEVDPEDFAAFYSKTCSGTLKYVTFARPSAEDYADITLYSRYGKRNEEAFSRADLASATFGYDDYEDADYDLEDLSIVSDDDFSGSVTLNFTAHGGSGSRANQTASGTLVITTSKTSGYYAGEIRYTATAGTAVQINANDISRLFSKHCPGSTLKYVLFNSIPATGSLYYNYYGTSQYGGVSKWQLTTATAAGRVFSFSPESSSEYALSELTYLPTGSNYCTTMTFTAYGADGKYMSASILISITASAVSEVYAVTAKGTSVNFPASAVYTAVSKATGSGLSAIQFLALPDASAGTLYQNSTKADLTTAYPYGNGTSGAMSQLRFVPSSKFTGSVTLPYVALDSKGVALGSGVVSIGVVSSVKKFSDVSSSTWCYKYVTELSDAGIISGYANGSFQEKNTITYGAALKLIMLAAGYSEQAPTVKGSTFSGYLAKAKADGLVSGNPNLNGSITRLQIAQIAAKAMKLSTSGLSNKKPFTDTNDVYVQALNAAGIIEGYFSNGTSTYKPGNTLTRGQVSAIVWRMRNYSK